ncbi:alpha,alpha-trehalose-phosphate synthase (UDP-forming) [Jannaschia pagri]|uniref:Alpha,alpha-trehalose-phosphate synthase (UDP-forming) n=1 Tax=Jannaschia pagri TaxID=2829797 RepID=A0ABQ4NIH2_9RHOB|nr:alpha,alpha-trehalose-phosphate synthase (UDP-forming) [Jannaschia sp. AI_61]GIT94111.1 alpha,alpha-trehalose-phosphate synthase (UDP-forming) [Jannaschia sp. AI_62]
MPAPEESTGRLIVLSNRIPKGDVPAGGLVFALHEALTNAGGLWIGAGDPSEQAQDGLTEIGSDAYTRFTFDLTETEHKGFYLGYSNSVLWPLFHHRSDLLEINAEDFEAYAAVNARVARSIAAILRPDDVIWIHDYHFLMVAAELRALGVEARIGLFLHIPFPNVTDILALPEAAQFPTWLAAHDIVGLQAQRDVAAAFDVLRQDERAQVLKEGTWGLEGRVFSVLSFPIGIDAEGFAETAAAVPTPELQLAPKAPLLIGVDRLDYSKGLVHRFQAFGTFLAGRDEDAPRPTFLQIAPVSREDVAAYQDIREELERAAGSINGAHADLDWTPIRYVRRHIDREHIAALYRRADVALVTPLADGMNLVAKEFVAAQDPNDPGVLILSHFAGAAEQMEAALLVNPFDETSFAETIAAALTMPLEERMSRHGALMRGVFEQDIAWWTTTYLDRLRDGVPSLGEP